MFKINKTKSHTKENEDWKRSTISRTIPSYRNGIFKTTRG